MTSHLDFDEQYMLDQLCNASWLSERRYDAKVRGRLERGGLAQTSLLGRLCPTPAGRLLSSLFDA